MPVFILGKQSSNNLGQPSSNTYVFRTTKTGDEVVVNNKRIGLEDARELYRSLISNGYTRIPNPPLPPRPKPNYHGGCVYEYDFDRNEHGDSHFDQYSDPVYDNHPGWSEYGDWTGENAETESSWNETHIGQHVEILDNELDSSYAITEEDDEGENLIIYTPT